jgi:hypothetical protein
MRVEILNSGRVGAQFVGNDPGFGPWQELSDVHRLPAFIENSAKSLIIEAHEVVRETLSVPVVKGPEIRYRQRLGTVTSNDARNAVLVEVCYEVEDVAANTTSAERAVFRCC